MPTTRKKVIKTVYKDEISDEEEGGDFSDSGSEAIISDVSSSEDDIISESSSPEEEFDDRESFNKSKRKYPTKVKSARNFTRKSNIFGCDITENQPVFSIKDLTATDKLLPPILNLSESDSSDEDSPNTLNRSSFTSFQLTDQDNNSDNEVNTEYKNIWSKIEKAPDQSEEIAKKTFMELEQHKSKIEETKATLQNYTLIGVKQESNVKDLLALGEEILLTPEDSPVNKKSKRCKVDSDSDMEDWEEVKDTKTIPQQGIQLLVEFPDAGRRKPKKIDVEMMMKRKINRVKKEYQVYMHKVHVLCWLGHGNYISNVLNNKVLMAAALTLVPSKERRPKNKVDVKYIEEIITYYKDHITFKKDKNEEKFKPKAPPLKSVLLDLIKRKVVISKKYLIFIFVILLRALGLKCRIIFNFITLPIRPPATELCSLSTKPKDKKASKSQKQDLTIEESKLTETKTTMPFDEGNKTKVKSNTRKAKSKKQNIAQVDGNYDLFFVDEIGESRWNGKYDEDYENIMQVDGGDDISTTRRTRLNKRNRADANENVKDENISPPKKSRKIPRRISLKRNVTCDENKNMDVNKKAKKGKIAVESDEKYKSYDYLGNNSNLKELTNITSDKNTQENTLSPKLLRKSSRLTQQTPCNSNEKKDMPLQKRNLRNLKTSDMEVKLNQPDKSASTNYEIIEEDVSSLKTSKKCTRRNTPMLLADNCEKNVALNKKTQRLRKTVDLKVKPKPVAKNEDKTDTYTKKNLKRSKKVVNTEEKHRPCDHNTTNTDDLVAITRSLTRSQKSKHANDNIDAQEKNESKNQKTSTITTVTTDKLKIPRVILTRDCAHVCEIKNNDVENTNTTEIQSRMTRKRTQTASKSPKDGNNLKASVNKEKSVRKTASHVAMKENICDGSETSQKTSKEELSESKQTGTDKKLRLTKNNSHEMMEESKNKNNVSKLQTRKKSLRGKIKQEADVDADYSPINDPKHNHTDSDDSFKPPKLSPNPKTGNRGNRRVLANTNNVTSKKNQMDIWCEVFVEELQEWISIDIINGKIKSTKEIYANTTQPVCYVVSWDNNNYIKDLTRKYVPHFNTETRKLRVDVLWWNKAVHQYLGPKTARDKKEDEYLDKMQLEAPLPTVIGEYKNHPLYVLKRHLLKFEAIYPPDSTILGFVRGEPVYARECVYTCRSRNIWYKKHAKVVRLGEKAYKLVKAQPRWDKINRRIITDDPPMEIFGPWQVEDFEPPVAENGIVPRNEYGNVELFKECMLPKGTVHLKLPGLNRIAKKLNIDCATAITGFEVNHGWVRPVYDGFVVCKEFEDIITEAWAEDQEEQERKELERTELRVFGNWKRLIKGLLIRERLKNKYGFNESPTSTTSKGKSKGSKQVAKKRK